MIAAPADETLAYQMLREAYTRLSVPAGLAVDAARATAPITTDDELWEYVSKTWGVEIPRLAVCPTHTAPFTAFADAFFARSSMTVWHGSRGLGGKSMLLATLGLTEAVLLGSDVNILGGSGEQSKRVHDYMGKAWNGAHAPRHLLASDPAKMETRLTTGNIIKALLASQASVRGSHPARLRMDEVDEMALKIFDAAMGQTMAQQGVAAQTVLSSTHQYPDGTFSEVLRRAKEKGWRIYEWCYRENLEPHGWLSPDEVARKRNEVTAAMWDAEYDLQEPSPENRAILTEAVAWMFKRELGIFEGRPREYLEIEPPVPGAQYVHGADWAKSQDWTEIVTFRVDVTPIRLVAYERMQRLPWPMMVGRFDARVNRYKGRAAHDQTGLGDVVDGYLTVRAEGVILVGRGRSDLFNEYISGIEQHDIESPYITALEGQHRYVTIDDLYGAGHPPDGFVAGALAYHASGRGKRRSRFLPIGT